MKPRNQKEVGRGNEGTKERGNEGKRESRRRRRRRRGRNKEQGTKNHPADNSHFDFIHPRSQPELKDGVKDPDPDPDPDVALPTEKKRLLATAAVKTTTT
jgi:hypothetical protein